MQRVAKRDPTIIPESCEERFRLGLDNISDAVYVLDTVGRFVFVNRAMVERSGLSSEDYVGRHFLEFLDPMDKQSAAERFEKVIGGEEVPPYEVAYRARNGRRIWVEVNSKALHENGRIVGSIGISRDVRHRRKEKEDLEQRVKERTAELEGELRERVRAEKALKRSEQKFRELAELLPEVVFEIDRKGMLTYTNREGFHTFGYSQEILDRGKRAYEIFAEEDRARLRKNIDRIMKGRKLGLGQYVCLRKDGSTFPAFVHGNAILDDEGNPMGLRGVLVDISAQKQAEEEILTYQKHLSTLASELSLAEERIRRHTAVELHDSVAQILAFTKMKLGVIRKSAPGHSLTNSVDEVISLVEEAIANIRGIISELSSPILYDMGLVSAVEWLVQRMRQSHGLDIELIKDREPGPLAPDIKILLFQIVRELLVNVAKHANASKTIVKMETERLLHRIHVEDDGRGFDADNLTHEEGIPHFGLFSIRVRLESMGGRFRIKTSPGNGTSATLTIPLS
jgi:PAS domain S-box-containing protein